MPNNRHPRGLALALMLAASSAWAHEGHGMGATHWHATDTLGLLVAGGLAAFLVWLLRGR